MSSNFRSIVTSSIFGAGLASVLMFAACKSFEVITPPGTIKIVGKDGVTITAEGLEEALQKAIEAKKAAELRGDKTGAADWQVNIQSILKQKKSGDAKSAIAEAEASGNLEVTTNENGATVYSWTDGSDSGAGPGSAGN